MATGKETPRQKMIGMMYLVLTALLAMNISKEVLDAFVIVNNGLQNTNENFVKKNSKTLEDLSVLLQNDEALVKPFYNKAYKAKMLCRNLITYVDSIKKHIIQKTEGIEKNIADTIKLAYVDKKDNYDIPTYELIGDDPGNIKSGSLSAKELKNNLGKLRTELISLFSDTIFLPATKKEMEEKLNLKTPDIGMVNGVNETWETYNFNHIPLAAVITNLSKIQNDIHNAEADVINTIYGSINKTRYNFDKLEARALAPSGYVLMGEEYNADVMLIASSTTKKPEIILGAIDTTIKDININPLLPGDTTVLSVSDGKGRYAIKTSSEGLKKWSGVIKVDNPKGGFSYYPFQSQYTVAKPAAAVSITKMNVFYRGLTNPVKITAAGVAPEDLLVSISNGATITGSKGDYNVTVKGIKEGKITIRAKMNGEIKEMGTFDFRALSVPTPEVKIPGQENGKITRTKLLAASRVIAFLENFPYETKYEVLSFNVFGKVRGNTFEESSTTNKFTPQMINNINSMPPGSKLYFSEVKIRKPDESTEYKTFEVKIQ